MTVRRLAAVVALAAAVAAPLRAQAPHREHRTLRTEHFAIHFAPALEPLARRAAAHAERAWAQLGAELAPPRGTIELLVSDDVDYANGYATVFPTNRIVVYAHPPIDSPALRYNDDWLRLVITHELAHIFHLDRSRGSWRALQSVFGRNPLLFPGNYSPRWVTEGLATYYESRLTGLGRVRGSYHRELALAAAREGGLPRIDQLSAANPVFPGGNAVYVYGSLLFDHLAQTRGAARIPAFVERAAVLPVPFLLDRAARGAFGTSYRGAWRELADSLDRAAGTYRPPLPGWRDLTPASLAAEYLRWERDGTLTYTGAAPRERYGAYAIAPDGTRRFIGRRNADTPNARLADGGVVFAQPDYTDPYTVRSDLYLERDGRTTRLTRGARLAAPDARADGRLVAVQAIPGGSRLVTLDRDGRAITPITEGSALQYWAEPRWSPDGAAIAAIRWTAGRAAVVILDTAGDVQRELAAATAVLSAPVWSADGRAVLFASDRDGRTQLHRASLDDGATTVIGDAPGSLFFPAVSPDLTRIAAVRLGAGGFRVGEAPLPATQLAAAFDAEPAPVPQGELRVDADVTPYRAARQLLPRFWMPIASANAYDVRLGAFTAGQDILRRHSWEGAIALPVEGHGVDGAFAWSYAGLARPVLGVSVGQAYDLRTRVVSDDPVAPEELAHIDRRVRSLALSATFLRPRMRSSLSAVIAAGADWRANVVRPDIPLAVDPAFYADSVHPRVTAGLAYARVQRAPYAISPEDGFTFSLAGTNRWVGGLDAAPSQVVTGIATAYRSLPLPGYARHVLALRLAGGVTDERALSELQVGGVSGRALPVAFGLATIGEGERTFFVRGFPAATLVGTRAWAASAEYRAPLLLLARGAGTLPVFLERTSLAAFADAGSAWCPTHVPSLCYPGVPRTTIGSVGGEARVNLAFGSWDEPFQLRAGIAVPVRERPRAELPSIFYLTTGLAF